MLAAAQAPPALVAVWQRWQLAPPAAVKAWQRWQLDVLGGRAAPHPRLVAPLSPRLLPILQLPLLPPPTALPRRARVVPYHANGCSPHQAAVGMHELKCGWRSLAASTRVGAPCGHAHVQATTACWAWTRPTRKTKCCVSVRPKRASALRKHLRLHTVRSFRHSARQAHPAPRAATSRRATSASAPTGSTWSLLRSSQPQGHRRDDHRKARGDHKRQRARRHHSVG